MTRDEQGGRERERRGEEGESEETRGKQNSARDFANKASFGKVHIKYPRILSQLAGLPDDRAVSDYTADIDPGRPVNNRCCCAVVAVGALRASMSIAPLFFRQSTMMFSRSVAYH